MFYYRKASIILFGLVFLIEAGKLYATSTSKNNLKSDSENQKQFLNWIKSIAKNRKDFYYPSTVLSEEDIHLNSSFNDSIFNALNLNFSRIVNDSETLEAEESKISFIVPNPNPLLTQLKPQYGQRLFTNGLQNAETSIDSQSSEVNKQSISDHSISDEFQAEQNRDSYNVEKPDLTVDEILNLLNREKKPDYDSALYSILSKISNTSIQIDSAPDNSAPDNSEPVNLAPISLSPINKSPILTPDDQNKGFIDLSHQQLIPNIKTNYELHESLYTDHKKENNFQQNGYFLYNTSVFSPPDKSSQQFSDVLSLESNYDNKETAGLTNFNQNTQKSIYSGPGIHSQILNFNSKENQISTQTSHQPIGSDPNIPLTLDYKPSEFDISKLFAPYESSPLNFDPFSLYDNKTSKDLDTSYVSTLQQNPNIINLLAPPNSLTVNQNEGAKSAGLENPFAYQINNIFQNYENLPQNQVLNTGTYDPNIAYENLKNNLDLFRNKKIFGTQENEGLNNQRKTPLEIIDLKPNASPIAQIVSQKPFKNSNGLENKRSKLSLKPGENFVNYNVGLQGFDGNYQLEDGPNNTKIKVFRLIPRATIEAVPMPPISEYDKRPENDYIVKVEEVPLPPPHVAKYEPQFDDEVEEKTKEKIVENPDNFPPKKPEPYKTSTTTISPKLNDKLKGPTTPKPSAPKKNEKLRGTSTPKPSTSKKSEKLRDLPTSTTSTPKKNEELRGPTNPSSPPPPETSSPEQPPPPPPHSNGPHQYPPPPPPYPPYDYHSPCEYGPHYYPPLDCRPPYPPPPYPQYRPPYPPKPYRRPPPQYTNYEPHYRPPHKNNNYNKPKVTEVYSEFSLADGPKNYNHFARSPIMDYEPAHPPPPPLPIIYNKPGPPYLPNNANYNEDQYHPPLPRPPPPHTQYHLHEPPQPPPPFHHHIHHQLYQPHPAPPPYHRIPRPHHYPPHPPSGPYPPNGKYPAKKQINHNYRNPNRPLPFYPKSNHKHQYVAQPKINNNFRPFTKCDMKIPARLLPQLKLASGAPFPPNLDQYYRPIRYNPDEPLKVFWKHFDGLSCADKKIQIINLICSKDDKNCAEFNPPKTVNFRKFHESNDWTPLPDDPVYKFMESEHNYQAVVPQEVPKNNDNSNIDDETKRIRGINWTGISGRSYDSYTFPCKGKSDGFYADLSYNCEVYYKCLNYGIDKKYKCPKGMRFNQSIQTCDWGQQVNCGA